MKVALVASTYINEDALEESGYILAADNPWDPAPERDNLVLSEKYPGHYEYKTDSEYSRWLRRYPKDPDELAEAAGRGCYQSYDRPNEGTGTNDKYLKNILSQGHFSVLEHASATFYISGVSRSLLAELTRHRHLSYSVLSQRYVDHGEAQVLYPPILDIVPKEIADKVRGDIDAMAAQARATYDMIYQELSKVGVKTKDARGAARTVLLEGTETKLYVTGNHRAWRDMLWKRLSPGAEPEIRELAKKILTELKAIAPNTFQDF